MLPRIKIIYKAIYMIIYGNTHDIYKIKYLKNTYSGKTLYTRIVLELFSILIYIYRV